jgi:Flp pilus assembly pilin Flp
MENMKKSAQSLIEYGLILALVAVIAVTVLSKFGATVTKSADKTNETVTNVSNNASSAYCNSLTNAADKAQCNAAAGN